MNLLLLTYPYLPSTGGVQRSVHNLATGLAARGHAVTVAASGSNPIEYSREGPVNVIRLRIPTAFRWKWRDRARLGIRDAFNVAALAALCVHRQIELVHCHLINMDTHYALALRYWLGVKVAVTLRGGEFGHWVERKPHRQVYVRRVLEEADAVTALSKAQMADARAWTGNLPPLTAVIPNPVDPQRLAALSGPAMPSERPYAVCAGRLEAEKSVDLLIGAFHRLVGSEPDYPLDLVISGWGSCGPGLKQLAAGGPAAGRIRFTGEISYADSLGLIRNAALLVLPTERGEGCPNVVLEAMAMGTPVIASANPPLLELIEHRVNGETFPSGDATALGERLGRLGRDAATGVRYAAAARVSLELRHGMDRALDRYEHLYRQLLGRRA